MSTHAFPRIDQGTSRDPFAAAFAAAGRAHAIAFDDCLGVYHPAGGRTGIVMCGAWGYEDLVLRAAWRELAARLAARGFPCLRFDYPATGNSLGDPDAVGLDDWAATASRACDLLASAGVSRIVLLGHGVGTIVARAAAALQPNLAGLVLMAPTGARRFLRESAHLAAMLASGEAVAPVARDGLTVAGFTLPPRVHADLKARRDPQPSPPAGAWMLLVEPDGRRDGSVAVADGVVERLSYPGFDALMGDPTTTVVPFAAYDAVADALVRLCPEPLPQSADRAVICPPRLATERFREEAVSFGQDQSLFGVLCTPAQTRPRAMILFLNTGRNPHTGWRRMTVETARALAEAGVSSLRFDIAGVGESPPRADRPGNLLFSSASVVDVRAALDLVAARGYEDAAIVGVCSGAYLGLLSAVEDARVRLLFAVNMPRFAWGRRESIEAAVRFANRPAAHSVARLLRRDTLKRILGGQLDPRPAALFKVRMRARRWGLKAALVLRQLSPAWDIYRSAHGRLRALARRNVKIFLGYGETDGGFDELELLFGRDGRRLPGRSNISLDRIAGVDHNLTQDAAGPWLLNHVLRGLGIDS